MKAIGTLERRTLISFLRNGLVKGTVRGDEWRAKGEQVDLQKHASGQGIECF